MATKKDEIIQLLLQGKEIEEIVKLGYNKKYSKEVLREYNKKQSINIDEIVEDINDINKNNKMQISSNLESKREYINKVTSLLNKFLDNNDYLEYLNIDLKISIDKKKYLENKKVNKSGIVNPIDIYRKYGREKLISILKDIDIETLKEIARQYTPDLRGYVYKWSDKNKIIDYIVERSNALSNKGNVFISYDNE